MSTDHIQPRRPGEPPTSWTSTVGTHPPAKAPPRSPAPPGEASQAVRVEVAKVEGPGVCCILSTSQKSGCTTLGRIQLYLSSPTHKRSVMMLLSRAQIVELQKGLSALDAALEAEGK
jgi:hypothetical protein